MVQPEKKSDNVEHSPGEMALGCVFILFLLWGLGSCVFGGSDDPKPSPAPAPSAKAATVIPEAASSGAIITGSTMLEQAIFDAFPSSSPTTKKDEKTAANAAEYIGATIVASGHLCAKPIEAQRVATGQYGIGCRKYRAGGGQVNYIVDVRTGNVSEI